MASRGVRTTARMPGSTHGRRMRPRTFVAKAKAAGPQPAAFYALALESGARKGELCGLRWSDLDLDAGKMRTGEYAQLIKSARVRPIKFHGLRHTCATLLLQAGQPVHIV